MAIDPRIPLQATVPDIFGAIQRGMEFADQRRTQPIVEELLKQREIQGRQQIAANRRQASQDEIDEAFRKAELGVGIARGIVENTENDEDVPAALEQLLPQLQQLGFTDEDLRSVPLTRNGLKLFADALGDKLRKAGAPDSVGSPIISVTGEGEDLKYSVVQPVMDAGELVLQEQDFPGTPVTASLALDPESKVGHAAAKAGATTQATQDVRLVTEPKVTTAVNQAKGRVERAAETISIGADAARGIPTLRRGLELLNSVKTAGFRRVALQAKQFFGVEGADEAELSGNLGKAILSQLRATFGAQFTEREGARLESIEANFGRSVAGNRRLLEQTLKIVEDRANRGIKAAVDQEDFRTAADIQETMDLTLTPPAEPTGRTATNPDTGERVQQMSDGSWVPVDG